MAVLTGITLVDVNCGEKKPAEELPVNTDPCSDLSGLSENDLETRKKFNYVDESPDQNRICEKCNLYLPGKATTLCGSCTLFKGPVMAAGTCIYWTPVT